MARSVGSGFVVRIAPAPAPYVAPNNVNVAREDEEEARATQPATDTTNTEPFDRKRQELDAPRQYAQRCARTAPPGTPIYYIDTFGDFHELGNERVRRAPLAEEPYYPPLRGDKKRARCVETKVWGPDETRGLAAGEWEMEDRIVAR